MIVLDKYSGHSPLQARINLFDPASTLLKKDLIEDGGINDDGELAFIFRKPAEGVEPDKSVLILVPVSDYAVGVPAAGLWRVRLNSDGRAYDAGFGDHPAADAEAVADPLDGYTHRIITGIGPYSALIFSQDRPGA